MKHRHLITEEWTLMAIASLFERGERHDWEEFAVALRADPELAHSTMNVCEWHPDLESGALAKALIRYIYGKDKDMGLG